MNVHSLSTTNSNTIFSAICNTKTNEIYFTCYSGLGVCNLKTGDIRFYCENTYPYNYFPLSIIYNKYDDTVVYFSTPTTLTTFSCKNKTYKDSIFTETGYNLKLLKCNKIVFVGSTSNILYVSGKKTKAIISNPNLYDIDMVNCIWYISPTQKLIRYNTHSRKFKHICKETIFGTSSIKCSKDYVIVSNPSLSKVYLISTKHSKIIKSFSLLLSSQYVNTNMFMYSNLDSNNIWITTTSNSTVAGISNNAVNVYQYIHKKHRVKLITTVPDSDYTIGEIAGDKFTAYIYQSLYGGRSNQNIYTFIANTHGKDKDKCKVSRIFNQPLYQFTDSFGVTQTYQVLDQFITTNSCNRVVFVTSYKEVENQPINKNAINYLSITC